MLKGKTLQELATEVERQNEVKRDFVADTGKIKVETRFATDVGPASQLSLEGVEGGQRLDLSRHARRGLELAYGVPAKFSDYLQFSHSALYDHTLNTLMSRDPKRRLVRTLDGEVRAVLSDSYKIRDNWELLESVLPAIGSMDMETQVVSSEVTRSNLYLKVIFPGLTRDLRELTGRGDEDLMQAGFMLKNSEVGAGNTQIQLYILRLVCSNGMVGTTELKSAHVHRGIHAGEGSYEIFSDETKRLDDQAFFSKVSDVVKATANPEHFESALLKMAEASKREIKGKVDKCVEEVATRFSLNKTEGEGVLDHLIRGGDLSQWGLVNAITRVAHDEAIISDYDRSTELEAVGGRLLAVEAPTWQGLTIN